MSLVKERTMVHKTTEAIFYLIDSSSMLYILKISLNFTVSLSSAVILPLDYISHCQGDQFVSFFTLFFVWFGIDMHWILLLSSWCWFRRTMLAREEAIKNQSWKFFICIGWFFFFKKKRRNCENCGFGLIPCCCILLIFFYKKKRYK